MNEILVRLIVADGVMLLACSAVAYIIRRRDRRLSHLDDLPALYVSRKDGSLWGVDEDGKPFRFGETDFDRNTIAVCRQYP